MALIEIRNCGTGCTSWHSERHGGALSESKCKPANRDIDDPYSGVPDWCPLRPRDKPEPPTQRLWLVTSTARVLVAAVDRDEAENTFELEHDYDHELDVEGPIEETSHLPECMDWDRGEPPYGTHKPLSQFLMDLEDEEDI